MTMDIHWFDDHESLAQELASKVATDLRAAMKTGPYVSLAVSGGRSPVAVFNALRKFDLDWARVVITLVDERWVPENDPASNAALVRAYLLQDQVAAARFQPLYTGEKTAKEAEVSLANLFKNVPQPFAALILGMGDDGHTASLFPGSPNLDEGLALGQTAETAPPCLAQVGAVAPTERISLTLPWILNAHRVYLQFGGSSKIEVFETAQNGPNRQYPVSFVLTQQQTPVSVFIARN
jgi:6-phosphogluconolactonase